MAKKRQDQTADDPEYGVLGMLDSVVDAVLEQGSGVRDQGSEEKDSLDVAEPAVLPALQMAPLSLPMLPPGSLIEGHLSRCYSVNFEFPRHLQDRFRRFVGGLHASHATYKGVADKPSHVDTPADAFKWLISQLPE